MFAMFGFGTLGTLLFAAALIGLAFFLLSPRGARRLWKAAQVQADKIGRAASDADPLAVYKTRVDEGVENIAKAKKALEGTATLVRTYQRRVDEGAEEKTQLESRIERALKNNDANNTARDYALQLQTVEKDLTTNTEQLGRHKETYANFAKQVELNQKRVEEARREASSLGVELEQSEREKEFTKFAESFQAASFNDESLGDAKRKIQERIDANRAASDVARDMSRQSLGVAKDEEAEREAQADDILARFKK